MLSSAYTAVKGVLEGLDPIPPSLRWEAHHGSPVSTLCALEKTPLLATASTDSTVRLFTLADVQVTFGRKYFVILRKDLPLTKVAMINNRELGSNEKH